MSINWQVSSLEWSRKLKELGVVQDSIFYWMQNGKWDWYLSFRPTKSTYPDVSGGVSAFTVSELGVALPKSIPGKNRDTLFFEQGYNGKGEPLFNFTASETEEYYAEQIGFEGDTEANARSAMLCHLLENKIISLEEVNERLKGVRG